MSGPTPVSASAAQLVRATAAAIAVAAVLLVMVILPAEYGLDPSGVGRALGLYRPPVEAVEMAAEGPATAISSSSPLARSVTPYRTEQMTVSLRSGEGAEIKAVMAQGQRVVYTWTATGSGVDVDMHGEGTGGAAGRTTSYWKEEFQTADQGAFEAPFPGNHGWFWQNLTDDPVSVTVTVSGFYDKLFRP